MVRIPYRNDRRNGPVKVIKPQLEQQPPKVVKKVIQSANNSFDIQTRISEITATIKSLKQERQHLQQELKPWKAAYREKPWQLYALRLEGGYWYVGISRNPEQRFKKHKKGKGAMWTRHHPPIEIMETRPTTLLLESEASILEDKMTLEYAKKYGPQLVRGGGYCQVKPHWPTTLLG